jgi:hypothetical protein
VRFGHVTLRPDRMSEADKDEGVADDVQATPMPVPSAFLAIAGTPTLGHLLTTEGVGQTPEPTLDFRTACLGATPRPQPRTRPRSPTSSRRHCLPQRRGGQNRLRPYGVLEPLPAVRAKAVRTALGALACLPWRRSTDM